MINTKYNLLEVTTMILDNVLEEEVIYTEDSMVDMFVEGFLYALEMQEAGYKAGSIEELSTNLSEAVNVAINEVSVSYLNNKYKLAKESRKKHQALADLNRVSRFSKNAGALHTKTTSDEYEKAENDHNHMAQKRQSQAVHIKKYLMKKNNKE
jgi:hypothetical protein